jgi:hypothetical protein
MEVDQDHERRPPPMAPTNDGDLLDSDIEEDPMDIEMGRLLNSEERYQVHEAVNVVPVVEHFPSDRAGEVADHQTCLKL